MVNELQKFNATLKKYMDEAKVLEKIHPSKSVPLWTQICEYIVIFARSKNCPWQLRNKLVIQADQILQRVKKMQSEIEANESGISKTSSNLAPNTTPFPSTTTTQKSPFLVSGPPPLSDNSSNDEITEADFAALPDVSLDPIETLNTETKLAPDTLPANKNPFVSSESPSFTSSDANTPTDVIKNLARIEEELKKMPSGLKDLHSTSPSGPLVKDETIILDVTTSSIGNSGSSDGPTFIPSETPTGSMPFHVKGVKDDTTHVPVRDPFGPVDLTNQSGLKGEEILCFACGSSVSKSDKICPQCGTPLQ